MVTCDVDGSYFSIPHGDLPVRTTLKLARNGKGLGSIPHTHTAIKHEHAVTRWQHRWDVRWLASRWHRPSPNDRLLIDTAPLHALAATRVPASDHVTCITTSSTR